jgi:hypothetical protein
VPTRSGACHGIKPAVPSELIFFNSLISSIFGIKNLQIMKLNQVHTGNSLLFQEQGVLFQEQGVSVSRNLEHVEYPFVDHINVVL